MPGNNTRKSRLLETVSTNKASESESESGRKVVMLRYTPSALCFEVRKPTLSQATRKGTMPSVATSSRLSSGPSSSAPVGAVEELALANRRSYNMVEELIGGPPCGNCERRAVGRRYLGPTGCEPLCRVCLNLRAADGKPPVWRDMATHPMPEVISDRYPQIKGQKGATLPKQSDTPFAGDYRGIFTSARQVYKDMYPVADDYHGLFTSARQVLGGRTKQFVNPVAGDYRDILTPARHVVEGRILSSKKAATLQKSPSSSLPIDKQPRDAVDNVLSSVADSVARSPKKRSHEVTELVSDTPPCKLFRIAGIGSEEVRNEPDFSIRTGLVNGTVVERFVAEAAQEDQAIRNAGAQNAEDGAEEAVPKDEDAQAAAVKGQAADEGVENESRGSSVESSDIKSDEGAQQDYKIAYQSMITLCRRLFELEKLEKENAEKVQRDDQAHEDSLRLITANKDIMTRSNVDIAVLTRQANIARVELIAKRPGRQSEYGEVLRKAEQTEELVREKTEEFPERGRAELYAGGEETPLNRRKSYKNDLEDTKRELEKVRAELRG